MTKKCQNELFTYFKIKYFMLNIHCKHFYILIFFIISMTTLSATPINIANNQAVNILENSRVYFSDNNMTLKEIIDTNRFQPYNKHYINTGMMAKTIWIKLHFTNNSDTAVEKSLILTSALLEHIALYTNKNLKTPQLKGVHHMRKEHHTLYPFYSIKIDTHSNMQYYLQIRSKLTPVDFGLQIKDEETFFREDQKLQFINILLIGFVFALALYSFILFFYTKDKSYFYYSVYLFALIYQQMTYLGLTQVYLPLEFIAIDMQIPVFKINILIITAALFAIHFLKIENNKTLYTVYRSFIGVSLFEILFLSNTQFYNLYIVIFTGFLFIVFNLFAGIISYKHGHKQARLFIVGFGIVFLSYLLIILDAIGLSSVMQHFQNILMVGTAFEALILSLAFADRYIILQKEKALVDTRILTESKERTAIIEYKVIEKTEALEKALETKDLLLREVHHRVKNNLQIILSIIRLQNDSIKDKGLSENCTILENRINAIATTYNMLLLKDDLEEIDMQTYIDTLLTDIDQSLNTEERAINTKTDIDDILLPLRESVYIGLIVNELITNAYKYAFDKNGGTISITLQQKKDHYFLTVEDDGKGFDIDSKRESLGLKLINTLVYNQLNGEMQSIGRPHTKYTIRFKI